MILGIGLAVIWSIISMAILGVAAFAYALNLFKTGDTVLDGALGILGIFFSVVMLVGVWCVCGAVQEEEQNYKEFQRVRKP